MQALALLLLQAPQVLVAVQTCAQLDVLPAADLQLFLPPALGNMLFTLGARFVVLLVIYQEFADVGLTPNLTQWQG